MFLLTRIRYELQIDLLIAHIVSTDRAFAQVGEQLFCQSRLVSAWFDAELYIRRCRVELGKENFRKVPVVVLTGMLPHRIPLSTSHCRAGHGPVSAPRLLDRFFGSAPTPSASTAGQRSYCSFAYSALACLKIGMSGSASFLYSALALGVNPIRRTRSPNRWSDRSESKAGSTFKSVPRALRSS